MEKSASIVATFTADFIYESLKFLAEKLGHALDVSFLPYGQVFQQLLEPGCEFTNRQTGWNIVLLRVDDLLKQDGIDSPDTATDDKVKVRQLAKEFSAAVSTYAKVGVVPILIVITESKAGYFSKLSEHFTRILVEMIGDLPSVQIVASKEVTDLYPVEGVFEDESDRFGHVPYTEMYFAALASYILRMITMMSRPEKKVLVLDCDNTLWKGVCGEDGDLGVAIEGGYRFLQTFVMHQLDKGRLVCLVSKNVESDVKAVFTNNPQMLIPWEKLTSWKINWQPKSENLRKLAAELNLGLDSFVLLDDNPIEIAEVTANCPQVLSVQIPKNDIDIPNLLKHIWVFDKFRVTEEDKKRANSYRDNVKRQQLLNETSSFADFLEKLDVQVDIEALTSANQSRVAQLSQRTSQFNTTTRRHDEMALRKVLSNDATACHTIKVRDRFGDYGLVGVIMTETAGSRLIVTDFMLSCRVLGKGVEHKMLAYAGKLAVQSGINQVEVQLVQTARNEPVRQFLNSLDCQKDLSGEIHLYRFIANALSKLQMQLLKPGVAQFGVEDESRSNPRSLSLQNSDDRQGESLDFDRLILAVGKLCSHPFNVLEALSNNLRERPSLQQSYSRPKEGLENSLARIWQRVLRLKQVGRSDRFVDLGGTSVQLVKIHTLILEQLGVDVPITALFKYATVSALAEHLQFSGKKDSRMVAARERALKTRNANRAHFKKMPRRSNG